MTNQELTKKEKEYVQSKTIWGGKTDKGYIKYETPSGETVSLKLGRD